MLITAVSLFVAVGLFYAVFQIRINRKKSPVALEPEGLKLLEFRMPASTRYLEFNSDKGAHKTEESSSGEGRECRHVDLFDQDLHEEWDRHARERGFDPRLDEDIFDDDRFGSSDPGPHDDAHQVKDGDQAGLHS